MGVDADPNDPNATRNDDATAPPPQFEPTDNDRDGKIDRVGIDDRNEAGEPIPDGKVDREVDAYTVHMGDIDVDVAIRGVRYKNRPDPSIDDVIAYHRRDAERQVRGELEPLLDAEREMHRTAKAAVKKLQSTWAAFWRWVGGLASASGVAYVLMAVYYGHAFWTAGGAAPSIFPTSTLPPQADRQAVYDTIKGSLLDEDERRRVREAMGLTQEGER